MDRNNSVHTQPQSPLDTKQYECERFLYETLSREIEQAADEITQQVNMIKDYRYDIKEQIELIALETFGHSHSNVQAHIYGSVATGLALPESDMDIVITGVNSFGSKDNHSFNISLLYDNIVKHFSGKVMSESKKILPTQVPIIKLTFSLSDYYDEKMKHDKTALPYVNFDSIEALNPKLKELAVDISICDSFDGAEHQGIRAAYFVETNLIQYPILRSV
jgi:DNA polymerase sigma